MARTKVLVSASTSDSDSDSASHESDEDETQTQPTTSGAAQRIMPTTTITLLSEIRELLQKNDLELKSAVKELNLNAGHNKKDRQYLLIENLLQNSIQKVIQDTITNALAGLATSLKNTIRSEVKREINNCLPSKPIALQTCVNHFHKNVQHKSKWRLQYRAYQHK